MIRVGLIGVGKMGISHYSILGGNKDVEVAAICDNAAFVTAGIKKVTKVETYSDVDDMISKAKLDAVIISLPSVTHFGAAKAALDRGMHVFVEKPLCLNPSESKALADLAKSKRVANQVGYHNRFIGTFMETRRLVQSGAIGEPYHIGGTAFGQVVIRPKSGSTWRTKKSEGGGCLHDYASHVVDLMNFIVGPPKEVLGARLRSIYSKDVEDAVYATFGYENGASGQLETNWSDDSYRKMSTTISVYGTKGKIIVDRQECKVYLREDAEAPGYNAGWNIRYITDLQKPVDFYVRGEEYSAQLDSFVQACKSNNANNENSFASAYETDRVIDLVHKAHAARA